MIGWLRARFARHDAPPDLPPPPEVPDIAPVLQELTEARRQLYTERRQDERHAAQHRREQMALRKEIRSGNFIADRLRGTHGGR